MNKSLNICIAALADKIKPVFEEAVDAGEWQRPVRYTRTLRKPHNVVSGKPYTGANIGILIVAHWATGYTSPAWGTFKQWKERGTPVLKGQKSTRIRWFSKIKKKDAPPDSEEFIPMAKIYSIFNSQQTEDDTYTTKPVDNDKLSQDFMKEVDRMLLFLDVKRAINNTMTPCYNVKTDCITHPDPEYFISDAARTHTLLHELGHWTGAENRMNRFSLGKISKKTKLEYAREELVAETFALLVAHTMGFTQQDNTIAYLASWASAFPKAERFDIFLGALESAIEAMDMVNKMYYIVEDLEMQALDEQYMQMGAA